MNRTRIKICGITTPEQAETAVDAGADAVGLVFVDASVRNVDLPTAQRICSAVGAMVDIVALFLNPDDGENRLAQVYGQVPVTVLQLHNRADRTTGNVAPMRVIRATAFEPERIAKRIQWFDEEYRQLDHVCGLIVDTPDPTQVGGGTGESFDWDQLAQVLQNVQPKVPIILAGGLTPDNVGRAIATVRPYAVDVSSGVEAERGVKDPARIRDFCHAVRQADRAVYG